MIFVLLLIWLNTFLFSVCVLACFCPVSCSICALNRRKIYCCTAVVFVCLLFLFAKKAITVLVTKVPAADLITVFILVPLSLRKSCSAALTTRCYVLFISYLISYNYRSLEAVPVLPLRKQVTQCGQGHEMGDGLSVINLVCEVK